MQQTLPQEKTLARTYRHFSVQPAGVPADNRKLEFFYIGKKPGVINKLIHTFDCGYAAENAEQARNMLKRLATHGNHLPDLIIADGAQGYAPLHLFSQFLATQRHLSPVPFIIDTDNLPEAELNRYVKDPFADDVISLQELGSEKLIAKARFWRKVKERINKASELITDDIVPDYSPATFSKRLFDISIALLMMVVLSPVFLLITLALRIESKGPVFYISKRAGRGYRIFNFYKFRTMEAEANQKISDFSHLNLYNPLKPEGPVFVKIDNDPRITRLGAFLRKCSLDELPQLLNVLKGDMSLVGNRPLPLYEAATLTTDEWAKRFMAPAGMTGLWQIRKKGKARMTPEERIRLDINYADRSNFLFDLWIMANTPGAVIQRTNA